MQLEGFWLPRWRSDTEAHLHFVQEVIFSTRSEFQKIEIVLLNKYGKCLVLDGIHQSAETDEFIYQEAIVHPALFLHPNPKKVLIIGSGAGNVLREVLKHPTVESAVMVDIDQVVVESCRKYLGWEQGAYLDTRTTLVIDDGVNYLENTNERFDCVIVDSTTPKPNSIAYKLYGIDFMKVVHMKLRDGGILSGLQSNANILYLDSHRTIRSMLKSIFTQVTSYTAYCPFYAISYAFTLSVKNSEIDMLNTGPFQKRLKEISEKLRFYDETTHLHMFSLPKYMRDSLTSDSPYLKPEDLIRY